MGHPGVIRTLQANPTLRVAKKEPHPPLNRSILHIVTIVHTIVPCLYIYYIDVDTDADMDTDRWLAR